MKIRANYNMAHTKSTLLLIADNFNRGKSEKMPEHVKQMILIVTVLKKSRPTLKVVLDGMEK